MKTVFRNIEASWLQHAYTVLQVLSHANDPGNSGLLSEQGFYTRHTIHTKHTRLTVWYLPCQYRFLGLRIPQNNLEHTRNRNSSVKCLVFFISKELRAAHGLVLQLNRVK